MEKMFEKMMKLPLFQGASHERMESLIEKLPFHFLKFQDGEKIIAAGDECTHLRFIVSGSVKVITHGQMPRVYVSQVLDSPNVIGPDYLFGRDTVYPYEVQALGTCGILQLRKNDYIDVLQSDKVFLFNILNYLSRNFQNHMRLLLSQSSGQLAERLCSLILSLTTAHSRDIKITFRQKELCLLMGARRTSLINALEEMKKLGMINYSASEIMVVDRKLLLNYTKSKQ